jgi:excisionase family DNA binding protein
MSLAEVVDDLLELEDLGRHVDDRERRRLDQVRRHLAKRERGAKVSEAALVLGVSQPTVRAWIDAGILPSIAKTKPVRVDLLALADLKRAVDLVRANLDDRQLLVHVMRLLRDRAALEGATAGFEDYRAGRTVPLGEDLKAEIAELRKQGARRRSTSR